MRSPDVAFVDKTLLTDAPVPKFFPGAPDLAVEVLSPSDTIYEIEEKIADFFAAGTRLIWVVNPRTKTVSIHRPGKPVDVLHATDRPNGA